MTESLAKRVIDNGGTIHPLIIPSIETNGTGLMNPSIFVDNDKLILNLRLVNYTLYHSEKKVFQHPYGPLTYLHPEDDQHLRTTNFYCELDNTFSIVKYCKINTSEFDKTPLWEFVGLEDARLVRWNDKLYATGVRRDTTTNGEGRMELSELNAENNSVTENSRWRVPATATNTGSYCEKNWMPIIDMPYHYVKWCNPVEIAKANPDTKTCDTIFVGTDAPFAISPRGGSQVIKYKNNYLAITHTVDLFKSEVGRKDAIYKHRFIMWDSDWNIVKYSSEFSLMDGQIEFACGMCMYNNNILVTYGFQDNAAYLLNIPTKVIEEMLNGK